VTVEPRLQPAPCTTPDPYRTAGHIDDKTQPRPTMRKGWARIWPSLLAAVTLPAVGGPAAVASYRHARDVIAEHGDPVMAPWLALTTDGMLLAALVVIWVRRHRREPVGVGPWAAFWAGMTATIAANLAAAQSTPVGRPGATDDRLSLGNRKLTDLAASIGVSIKSGTLQPRPHPIRKTFKTRPGRYPRQRASTSQARNPGTSLARTGTTARSGPGACLTATPSPGCASRQAQPGKCPGAGK
jgi:hypothetical protein